MHSECLLCVVNVLPLCPPFNLTVFHQQYCILYLAPRSLFIVLILGGPVGLALFLKAQNLLSRPPWKDSIGACLSQCSTTPGRERRPAGISSPFQALQFIHEIKYFQKQWGAGGIQGGGKGVFRVLFPSPVPAPCWSLV